MSREVRIGLLAVIAVGLFIWGYKYVLGNNILNRSNSFYIEYNDIDHLQMADPVLIHGYQVGTVKDIYLNPKTLRSLIVELDVERDIKLPQNTVAELRNAGMMGGKMIHLSYTGVCEDDCLKSGDYITGKEMGFLESMINLGEVDDYMVAIQKGVGGVVDSINASLSDTDPDNQLGQTVADLRIAITNLKYTTAHMNELFANSSTKLVSVLENIDSITETISVNNAEIAGLLQNANEITRQLASARLDTTIFKANKALGSTGDMMESLDQTIAKADQTFSELQALLSAINEGEGTMGKLMTDKSLYEELNLATQNLTLLLQDFRMHPKRYVNVSVFGKKEKPYEVPESDPAFDTLSIEKN